VKDAVIARGLVKHYGEVKALDGVDVKVPTGSVLGLLGPNGAGKTTVVRILTTLLTPDHGPPRWPGSTCSKTLGSSATHRPVRAVCGC